VGKKEPEEGIKPKINQYKIEAVLLKTVSRPDKDWALWGVTCIPVFDL
jgi:hypothetical protein